MKFFSLILITIIYLISLSCVFGQNPVWPVGETVTNYNQISATFAEKHTAFHGALDLYVADGNEYFAILDGRISNNAAGGIGFMITNHEFETEGDLMSNYKIVRYGDDVNPLNELENGDIINSGQAIGEIISGGHLHFEMWVRDCISGCGWSLVDPLNNSYLEYENLPPETVDVFEVELNDIILEPQGNTSGVIFDPGNGLTAWHFNSCKIHKKDRADSQGDIHDYASTSITVFGNILQTIHVRDTDVTDNTDNVIIRGEGLGIYECSYNIDNELKYKIKFDEIEQVYKPNWEIFFNHKYNTAIGASANILYGNHDYIKMHRLNTDQRTLSHKLIDDGIWKTRSKEGNMNIMTDIPINAIYMDGVYDLDYTVLDAAGNMDDAANEITVDNFQPFINRFQILPNITGPSENEVIFEYVRTQSENGTTLNDGLISNQSARIDNDNTVSDVQFSVLMSEPMEEMSIRYKYEGGQYTAWNEMTTSPTDPLICTFDIDDFVDGCILFNFRGEDKSGNGIINVYEETNGNTLGNNLFIPTRSGNNSWHNNPSFVGEDFFNSCTDCANLIESTGDCDEIENFTELSYVDCEGNYFVELNGIDEEFKIGWLDVNGDYQSGGSVHSAMIGQNCYVIQDDNGCCHFQGCIEVTGEERYADNFTYGFQDVPGGTKTITIGIEGASGLAYPIEVDYLNADGSEFCLTDIIGNSQQGASCVGFIVEETYCIRYTDANGCIYESCFTTPNDDCTIVPIVHLENITPECLNLANGSIEISIDNDDECINYAVAWMEGGTGLTATNLKNGTNCAYIKGVGCESESCITTICFDVPEIDNCSSDCEKILAGDFYFNRSHILNDPDNVTCETGEIKLVNTSNLSINFSVYESPSLSCLNNVDFSVASNSSQVINISCFNGDQSCAGKYCFRAERDGCTYEFCTTIKYCEKNGEIISCKEPGDTGSEGNPKKAEALSIVDEVIEEARVNEVIPKELDSVSKNLVTKINVFPNPFVENLTVVVESNDEQTLEIQLIDALGKVVYFNRESVVVGSNRILIQTPARLPSGLYALTIIDEQEKRYSHLIAHLEN